MMPSAEGPGLAEMHRVLDAIAERCGAPRHDEAEVPVTESDHIHRAALTRARADKRERRRGSKVGD
jgi:hypothetical protein